MTDHEHRINRDGPAKRREDESDEDSEELTDEEKRELLRGSELGEAILSWDERLRKRRR